MVMNYGDGVWDTVPSLLKVLHCIISSFCVESAVDFSSTHSSKLFEFFFGPWTRVNAMLLRNSIACSGAIV